MQMTEKEELVPASEAAKRLGVTSTTVLNWFADGKIRGVRNLMNRRVKIYETEIDRKIREAHERDQEK